MLPENIHWLPIDMPKFPIADFTLPIEATWYSWNVNLLVKSTGTAYAETEFRSDVKERFPELIEWLNLFPFKTIRSVKFNIQHAFVKPHVDFPKPDLEFMDLYENNVQNEPCGYRIVVRGRRQNSLFLLNSKGEKIYVDMPDDTDTYVLDSTSIIHGVEEDPDRASFFLHFEIDPVKHKELLSRSYKKYSQYAISIN